MKQEKQEMSPFASLSFTQQQDKWRQWRSRQLEYKNAAEDEPLPEEKTEEISLPSARPAPTRHRELDKVLSRHSQALKKAGAFQVTKGNGPQDRG